jgi:hypothetical protein
VSCNHVNTSFPLSRGFTRDYELLAAVISAGNAKNAVLGYVAFYWAML